MPDVKVCHMTSAHSARDVRIYHKECVSLAQAGFEVHYICPGAETETVRGVHVFGVPKTGRGRLSRMLFVTRRVYKAAKKTGSQIFHFHDPELMFAGLFLKWSGKKVIYDVHEDIAKQILSKTYIKKIFRTTVAFTIRKIERFVSRRMDYCFTATEAICSVLLSYGARAGALYNYPLMSEFPAESKWSDRKQEVCYIGGMSRERGLSSLVNAMAAVKPDVTLNIAGEPSSTSYLDELKSLPGWSKVNYNGQLSRGKAYEMMLRSKAGLVIFLPEPNHVEALPNKIFEYMSSGLPVIASDFPMWKKLIEDNSLGICVDPADPGQISVAIDRITGDDEMAEQMGNNGRRLVLKDYNWSAEEQKLTGVYNELSCMQ